MPSNSANGLHVCCIMDGNGRCAARHNIPRLKGHQAGVEALRSIVTAAPDNGVGVLTVYAFSSDNWRRPPAEIEDLIFLLRNYLDTETGGSSLRETIGTTKVDSALYIIT